MAIGLFGLFVLHHAKVTHHNTEHLSCLTDMRLLTWCRRRLDG